MEALAGLLRSDPYGQSNLLVYELRCKLRTLGVSCPPPPYSPRPLVTPVLPHLRPLTPRSLSSDPIPGENPHNILVSPTNTLRSPSSCTYYPTSGKSYSF